jgi:hypothetical protein
MIGTNAELYLRRYAAIKEYASAQPLGSYFAVRSAYLVTYAIRRRNAARATRARPTEGKDDNVYMDPEHLPEQLML